MSRNTTDLTKRILTELHAVIEGVVTPGMYILARSMVVVAVLADLLLVDPGLAVITIVVLGGAYALIYAFYQKAAGRLGRERVQSNRLRFKVAGEALGGIKNVKVLGCEREFVSGFPSLHGSTLTASPGDIRSRSTQAPSTLRAPEAGDTLPKSLGTIEIRDLLFRYEKDAAAPLLREVAGDQLPAIEQRGGSATWG